MAWPRRWLRPELGSSLREHETRQCGPSNSMMRVRWHVLYYDCLLAGVEKCRDFGKGGGRLCGLGSMLPSDNMNLRTRDTFDRCCLGTRRLREFGFGIR